MSTYTCRFQVDGQTIVDEVEAINTVKAKDMIRRRYGQDIKLIQVTDARNTNQQQPAATTWTQGPSVDDINPRDNSVAPMFVTNEGGGLAGGAGQLASAGGCAGLLGIIFVLGTIVWTFPLILGYYTARLAGTIKYRATGNTNFWITFILTISTFSAGTVFGHKLQGRYMPEIAEGQAAIVEAAREEAGNLWNDTFGN